jgi:hypothetical protein
MKCLQPDITESRFALGHVLITPGAQETLSDEDIARALARHAVSDWGDLPEEDEAANERALEHGGRLFSTYRSAEEVIFWVITEADRSATTVLLPLEY